MNTTDIGGTQDFVEGGSDLAGPDKNRRPVARWSISAAIALVVHGLIGALVLRWQAQAGPVEPTATIVIELSPVLAAPVAHELETPPVPEQVQGASPPEKVVEKAVDAEGKVADEKREAEDEMAPAQPTKVREEIETERVEDPSRKRKVETIEVEGKSEVEMVRPPKENDEEPIDAPRSAPEGIKRHEQTAEPKPVKPLPNKVQKRAVDPTAAKPRAAFAREATPQAPAVSTPSNSNALPNWKSQIIGILERNKRYPPEAQARQEHGISNLAFSLNRQGHVTSARIAGSSGSSALDAETLSLVHRVQPFPPPPPEVGGAQISLIVAIRYSSR